MILCGRWARIKMHSGPHLGECWFIGSLLGWHLAVCWLSCSPYFWLSGPLLANNCGPPKCHHSMWYVGQNKNWQWPTFGWVLGSMVCFWLTSGIVMAWLWPTFGKQKRSAQVPSFHAVCGPDEHVRCRPGMGQKNFAIWATFGWVLGYMVCFWLSSGIVMAWLWPTFG